MITVMTLHASIELLRLLLSEHTKLQLYWSVARQLIGALLLPQCLLGATYVLHFGAARILKRRMGRQLPCFIATQKDSTGRPGRGCVPSHATCQPGAGGGSRAGAAGVCDDPPAGAPGRLGAAALLPEVRGAPWHAVCMRRTSLSTKMAQACMDQLVCKGYMHNGCPQPSCIGAPLQSSKLHSGMSK